VLCAALIGCSQPSDRAEDAITAPLPVSELERRADTSDFGNVTTVQPPEDPLEAILQGDPQRMFHAVELARRDSVVDCMERAGWTLSDQEFANLAAPPPRGSNYTGYLLDAINTGLLAPSTAVAAVDPVREAASADCILRAEAEWPNPSTAVLAVLDQVRDDLGVRADGDARMIEASTDFDECVDAVGYGEDPTMSPPAELAAVADMVAAGYLDGSQDRSAVVAELERLRVIDLQFDGCREALQAVEAEVNGELLDQLMAADPGLIPGIQAEIADDLTRYQLYLMQD